MEQLTKTLQDSVISNSIHQLSINHTQDHCLFISTHNQDRPSILILLILIQHGIINYIQIYFLKKLNIF